MAIYTLSMNYIEGVGGDQSHLHNVFLKFSNPDCEHKAAMDKSKKLLEKYIDASKDNVDLQTWLDWMSRKKDGHFELIDVEIPNNVSEEEMYLKIAAATKPFKKIIVASHQCWKNFEYKGSCNTIIYNNQDVTVLDKDEAYKELNETNRYINYTINKMENKNNPWQSGSFYLFAALVTIAALSVCAIYLPIYAIPITIIAAILIISIVGALQLKNDSQLTDKTFLSLMVISLKQIPFLRKIDKNADTKEKE